VIFGGKRSSPWVKVPVRKGLRGGAPDLSKPGGGLLKFKPLVRRGAGGYVVEGAGESLQVLGLGFGEQGFTQGLTAGRSNFRGGIWGVGGWGALLRRPTSGLLKVR